jgi:hypothetical protein
VIEEKNKGQPQEQQVEAPQDLEGDQETPRRPIDRWIASLKQGMEHKKALREKSRQKATQDRMKPVLLGLLAVVVTLVILLGLFSTPMSKRKAMQKADRKIPNLGRPQVNDSGLAQSESLDRSVTPLLGADVRSQPDPNRGQISEGDLQKYGAKSPPRAAITQPARSPTPNSPTANSSHALGQIEFSDTDGRRESSAEVESTAIPTYRGAEPANTAADK